MTIRKALVLYNDVPAGVITKEKGRYVFQYYRDYLSVPGSRPVSITMPLQAEPFSSPVLFPAFANMLSEGANKKIQCRMLRIDEKDLFSLLLATGQHDYIGPVSFKEIRDNEDRT